MFSGASNFTTQVDNIFLFVLAISTALLFLITFLMIYFVFRYHRKRHQKAEDIPGNALLEIVWTVIPTILVLAMFYYGMVGFKNMRNAPKDAMTIDVTGRMWSWLFTYEGGVQTDSLYVPVGKPVKLNLHSADVIHSFYVPAFRIKEDVVPGLKNYLWFTAEQPGKFDLLCAEYCGLQHSYMLTKLIALPEEEFNVWYASARQEAAPLMVSETATAEEKTSQLVARGEKLIQIKGCIACHTLDGAKLVGPTFKGIWGKEETVVENGQEKKIVVDEAYLRKSILEPNAQVVKGYMPLMPDQSQLLTPEEIDAIVEFLKTMK